ncbi:MAG: zinc ABC transporter substrate-binding protein [Oscillospiraceae bacterium]|nr:zinc ABC transporter substrate-binding protein [Oscillospiraceae bacterium]
MKKIIAACAASMLAVTMCGCSASTDSGSDGKLSVITTIYPAYDLARQVFGDTAEVTLLLKPGSESHTYDPSAKDVVKISSCDLFIYNGGESDQWVDSILDGTGDINTLRMMDVVELHEEELSEGMQHEHDDHDDHDHETEEYDEHIWTSPKNAAAIAEAIETTACGIAPENTELYNSNADAYTAQINSLDQRFEQLLENEQRYFVFGDRFPLLYFFEEYDLNYYGAFPGCGSEVEPSAQTISFLLDKLESNEVIKTVFYIELSNHKIADTLAEDTGLPTAQFHTCHNISADDFAAGETYVSLMEKNYETLKTALGK